MQRRLPLALSVIAGMAIGAIAMEEFVASPAAAQANGFHAVAVAATSTVAWFVGQDGSARYCTVSGLAPASCVVVHF